MQGSVFPPWEAAGRPLAGFSRVSLQMPVTWGPLPRTASHGTHRPLSGVSQCKTCSEKTKFLYERELGPWGTWSQYPGKEAGE